jgi:hypothetical protein
MTGEVIYTLCLYPSKLGRYRGMVEPSRFQSFSSAVPELRLSREVEESCGHHSAVLRQTIRGSVLVRWIAISHAFQLTPVGDPVEA